MEKGGHRSSIYNDLIYLLVWLSGSTVFEKFPVTIGSAAPGKIVADHNSIGSSLDRFSRHS